MCLLACTKSCAGHSPVLSFHPPVAPGIAKPHRQEQTADDSSFPLSLCARAATRAAVSAANAAHFRLPQHCPALLERPVEKRGHLSTRSCVTTGGTLLPLHEATLMTKSQRADQHDERIHLHTPSLLVLQPLCLPIPFHSPKNLSFSDPYNRKHTLRHAPTFHHNVPMPTREMPVWFFSASAMTMHAIAFVQHQSQQQLCATGKCRFGEWPWGAAKGVQ